MGEIAFWLGPSAKNTKFSRKARAYNLVYRIVNMVFPIKIQLQLQLQYEFDTLITDQFLLSTNTKARE